MQSLHHSHLSLAELIRRLDLAVDSLHNARRNRIAALRLYGERSHIVENHDDNIAKLATIVEHMTELCRASHSVHERRR